MVQGYGAESDRLVRILSSEARAFSTSDLDFLEEQAARYIPQNFALHVDGVRNRYLGNQQHYTKAALAARYTRSWQHMPHPGLNFARLFAEQDATVYDEAPQRHVVLDGRKLEDKEPDEPAEGEDAEPVDENGRERAAAFSRLCRDARLDRIMPEVERRTVLVRTYFVRVDFGPVRANAGGSQDSVILIPLWPDNVRVIPHHSMPASMGTAVGCIVDLPQQDDDEEWREVWTRSADEDEQGKVRAWGPWSCIRMSTKGRHYYPHGAPLYPLPNLPIAKVTLGDPDGSPYAPPDYDLTGSIDDLNVEIANYKQVKALQAHARTVYAGVTTKPAEWPAGPDAVTQIGGGETLTALSFNPMLADLLDGVTAELSLHATLRQNATDAYSIDSTRQAESGISRQIKNEPMLKARRARVGIWKDFEEHDLLPLMVEVSDHWGGTSIHTDGIEYVVTPAETPEYEDAEARQRRAIEAEGEGLISKARAAVACGYYRSIDDAKAAGLSDKIEEPPPPQAFGFPGQPSRFQQRMQENEAKRAQPKPPPDEEQPPPKPAAA